MYSLFSFLAVGSGQSLALLKELTSYANGLAGGLAAVGKGIGAIMLLIVLIYYITSILDGGKFQIKMLLPLLIFLFVCNFNWISTPVISFTTTITESLVSSLDGARVETLAANGNSESANIMDMHNRRKQGRAATDAKTLKEAVGEGDVSDENGEEIQEGKKVRGLRKIVKNGINDEATQLSLDFQKEAGGEQYAQPGETPSGGKMGFTRESTTIMNLICAIMSFICKLMSTVLRAFGGVMSGIIVAFGPITFAFAIFPGQGGTIKSWFIRLCQFALYAPICALVDCFAVKIFSTIADYGAGDSILMAIAVAICNLVALTSVPSIASMIIEGAQGAVSLSNGLQHIGGALAKGGAVVGGGAALVLGRDRLKAIKDVAGGVMNAGVIGSASKLGQQASAGGHGFKGFLGQMRGSGRASRLNKR